MSTNETDSHIALPPDIESRIAAALAGDIDATSALYAIAAMLIRKGCALPEPLDMAIADRLDALAHAARTTPSSGDRRDALAAAAAPGRKAGQPKKKFTRHEYEIAGAIIATEHVGSIDERKEAAAEKADALFGRTTNKEGRVSEVGRVITALNARGLGKGMAGKKARKKNPSNNPP